MVKILESPKDEILEFIYFLIKTMISNSIKIHTSNIIIERGIMPK